MTLERLIHDEFGVVSPSQAKRVLRVVRRELREDGHLHEWVAEGLLVRESRDASLKKLGVPCA